MVMTIIAAGLTGCATGMPKRGEFTVGEPAPAMAADSNNALVTFLRESAFTGGGISYYIYEDGVRIGALKSGTWFMYRAKPGKHTYHAETEAKDMITLTVVAGENYYIVGGIGMGVWAGRPQLKEASEPFAKSLLPGLKYITETIGLIPE